MTHRFRTPMARAISLAAAALLVCCGRKDQTAVPAPPDGPVARRGSFEVTARLVEIPEGAIFQRDLYNYATILKYKVVTVHRGDIKADTIFVGQYNPWKARRDASDRRVKDIGGNVPRFAAGQTQRLALEAPIEDHFLGGIVNKYFGQVTGPIYWAVWTDLAGR